MKKLIVIFVLFFACAFAQRNPWDPYSDAKKPKPIVTEPSTYGAIFIGATFACLATRRYFINKK
jgi:hypothetical protein